MSAYFVSSRMVPKGTLSPIAQELFGAYEQGVMYDPSDTATLFQDSAGTTPVTALEQPVGLMLDKSGRGNHAFQATTTKRPVLSARVNALLNTENPSAWAYAGSRASAGPQESDGGFTLTALSAQPSINLGVNTDYPIGSGATEAGTIIRSIEFKAGTASVMRYGGASDAAAITVDVATGAVLRNAGSLPVMVTPLADGWFRVEYWHSQATRTASELSNYLAWGMTAGATIDAAGQVGSTIKVRNPSFVRVGFGYTASIPYQRVNTATDYDADPAKFPAYRKLDGVDDSHASATGGGGTAGFFFSASVTPQGGAGTARTLFSDAGTNTGYIVRLNTSNQLELAAGNGTAYTTIATAGTLAVGSTDIVQAWDDGTNLNVKIGNGAAASVARPVVSAGTAGYTMGQDNGASGAYFNGRIYSTIYRKDSGLTQVQREAVAVYQRQKARIA